jgi:alkylhydroperoxidase/carboxymuconolactone decarboxylase family protein YurZ
VSNDLHEKADAMRRSVLGDAHVDRSAAHADAEALPLLNVITDFAWGDVWTRPGLENTQLHEPRHADGVEPSA